MEDPRESKIDLVSWALVDTPPLAGKAVDRVFLAQKLS